MPPKIAYSKPAPGQLAPYVGKFQMPANYFMANATLTIRDRADYLEASWSNGPTTVIYPAGGDDFVDRTNWALVTFSRDADGKVMGFTYNLLQAFVAKRVPAP